MRYFIVDAFTSLPFKGNPAAVVVLDGEISARQMQAIAAEFNLAETAFLLAQTNNHWSLRWFTPKVEIDLCGHATLASSFTIWQQLKYPRETQHFSTQSGVLTATPRDNKIELNFPIVNYQLCEMGPEVNDRLKLNPVQAAQTEHDLLIELPNSDAVKNYQPDFNAITALPQRGLIITSKGDDNGTGVDFVSRFFALKINIPEDPVTGAIHCTLAPYWSKQLHKTAFWAQQLSERGGDLFLRIQGERVLLTGSAVCTMQGELLV